MMDWLTHLADGALLLISLIIGFGVALEWVLRNARARRESRHP